MPRYTNDVEHPWLAFLAAAVLLVGLLVGYEVLIDSPADRAAQEAAAGE